MGPKVVQDYFLPGDRLDDAETSFYERIQLLIDRDPVPFSLSRNDVAICGVDAAYLEKEKLVCASAVLLIAGSTNEVSSYSGRFTFPYASSLFFLREGPFVAAAVNKLRKRPELVCFDAHGAAHPRSRGLATICGMVLGIPSIGIAKSALIGQAVPFRKGIDKLQSGSKVLGYVTYDAGLKPKRRRPLFWSPGYSVTLEQLERTIIDLHAGACVRAVGEAHRLSRAGISAKR